MNHYAAAIASASLLAPLAWAQDDAAQPAPETDPASNIGFSFGLTYTNDYYFRGILQEDDAFIVQSYLDAGISLAEWDTGSLSATVGTWSSFHDNATGASNTDGLVEKHYEADYYLSLGIEEGDWSFGGGYTAYTSPNGAFGSVSELSFSVAYDDSEHLGAFALSPYAVTAFELGNNAADGGDAGWYLELGVAPGHTYEGTAIGDISLSAPTRFGLSLSDYYEDATGDDDFFGFFQTGVHGSLPLPATNGYGEWTLDAGIDFLFLGDATEQINSGDSFEASVFVALSASF